MLSKGILIVEDERPKLAHISSLITNIDDKISTRHAMSVKSAITSLEEKLPSLLLLDMTLPTYSIKERENGGRPQAFGGIEIMRHMFMSDIICPTILITGYEAFLREEGPVDLSQLETELTEEFPGLLHGVLHYNSTYAEWREELARMLKKFDRENGSNE